MREEICTKRLQKIMAHPKYNHYMQMNAEREAARIFCKHDRNHVLDVARIAYILNLEEEYGISREWIYAAAILHDIGRHVQYDTGQKHGAVGADLAPEILTDCGFTTEEQRVIVEAIACHSDKGLAKEKSLRGLLARADVLSRACYQCPAAHMCNWEEERKNLRFPGI